MQIQSPLSNLRQVLSEVKVTANLYKTTLPSNEAATRAALIDPVLKALGWDIANPNMVEVEKTAKQSRTDYAVRDYSGVVQVVVEAKSLNKKLSNYDSQTIQYGHAFQISSVFLTDGIIWQHFTDFQPQGFKPTKTLDLENEDLGDIAAYLVENLDAAKFWPEQPDVDVLAQRIGQLESDLRDLTQQVARLPTGQPPPPPPPPLNWVSLAPQILVRNASPSQLRLPNNQIIPVRYWKDVLTECCKYALATNPALTIPYADRAGQSMKLIDTSAPSSDRSFVSIVHQGQTVYVYTNYDASTSVANAVHILEDPTVASKHGGQASIIYR